MLERKGRGAVCAAALMAAGLMGGTAKAESFSLADALSYPFVTGLVSAPQADRIAWVRVVKGVRNVWVADGPGLTPRQVTQFTADDGH
jgi:hypothetical protein